MKFVYHKSVNLRGATLFDMILVVVVVDIYIRVWFCTHVTTEIG
jgi:hypothetical protein